MKTEINIDELKEIYLISNTATFLFSGYSKNESVQYLSRNHKTEEMTDAFISIAKMEIEEIEDLVYAYALYVSIMLKNDNKAYTFMESDGVINFEWFVELRSIYFARIEPINVFSFEDKYDNIKSTKLYQTRSEEFNNQIIEIE